LTHLCICDVPTVRCPAPRSVAGATITWSMTSYGDVAEYVCKAGYRFIDRQRTTSAVCSLESGDR